MDGCEYFLEVIIAPLKERMTETMPFGNEQTIVERIAQTMDDCKILRQNKHSILYRMDDCYSFTDKYRYPTSQDK